MRKKLLAITFERRVLRTWDQHPWATFLVLFSGIPHLAIFFSHMPICPYAHMPKYAHIWGIWAYGHMGICEKIWSSGVSPKRPSKMQLRNVNLRSVGPSVQKLWPTTFFAKKMPCILHGAEKKIRDVFSSQVSGRAQLPGVFIYWVDHFGNYPISGGHTCIIWAHPNAQSEQVLFAF